jgi:hypothetical protein
MANAGITVLARFAAACALLTSLFSAGCPASPALAPPAAPLTPPKTMCAEATPSRPCHRADEIEAWLRDARLRVLGTSPTPGGRQGALVLTLAVPHEGEQIVFRAKWRPLTSGSLTNDPRKELGAYAVEKLFLEPHEYVVPPTAGHCFPLGEYRKVVDSSAGPTFPEQGVSCVYGILGYWLENVDKPKNAQEEGIWAKNDIFDEHVFEKNGAYRKSVADLNVLTYLIRHGDAHDEQFLISKDRQSPRVYSVDNSIAFQSIKNPMLLFREDWSHIQVPAVSKQSVARLREVSKDSWASLEVIEQYEKRGTELVAVPSKGIIGPRDEGLRWIGVGLQIGLTEGEVAGVRDRMKDLLDNVKKGDVKTF